MTLIRFLRGWLRLVSDISQSTKAQALKRAHSLHLQGVDAGGRFTRSTLTTLRLWPLVKLTLISNIIILIGGFILGTVYFGVTSLVGYHPSGSNIDTFASILINGVTLTLSWTLMVTLNHWNDISNILIEGAQDVSGINLVWHYIGAATGYIYVVNWDMFTEFYSVLFSNPKGIFQTRAILEFVLLKDSIEALWNLVFAWTSLHVSTYLGQALTVINVYILHYWSSFWSIVGSTITDSWTYLVSGISAWITPNAPVILQPIVNPVCEKVAGAILASIILWILRIFFNFPI